jgi:hypothetical protein
MLIYAVGALLTTSRRMVNPTRYELARHVNFPLSQNQKSSG